jgi:hypothetical protein
LVFIFPLLGNTLSILAVILSPLTVCGTPLYGYLLDYPQHGFALSSAVINTVGILVNVVAMVPVPYLQIVTFFLWGIFRVFLFALTFAYVPSVYVPPLRFCLAVQLVLASHASAGGAEHGRSRTAHLAALQFWLSQFWNGQRFDHQLERRVRVAGDSRGPSDDQLPGWRLLLVQRGVHRRSPPALFAFVLFAQPPHCTVVRVRE